MNPPPTATAATTTRESPATRARFRGARFIARDGAVLPLWRWLPQGKPSAVVLALHGFNDYSRAFDETGKVFAAHGIATYAYDQRGFGAAPMRGRWPGTRHLVDDAATATALLRRRYPGVPLYLVGESMGGAVAVLASVEMDKSPGAPDGVVLLAPAVWGRSTMNIFEQAGLWFADLFPSVHWSPNLIPVSIRASDNIAMLDALDADPLVIKSTRSDTINGLVDLMGAALRAAPNFHAPALILYGEKDEIVPRAPVERFVDTLPPSAAASQRIAYYRDGYHLLTRDLEGPIVVQDILSWLERPGESLPSGADVEARERLAGLPVRPTVVTRTPEPPRVDAAMERAPS